MPAILPNNWKLEENIYFYFLYFLYFISSIFLFLFFLVLALRTTVDILTLELLSVNTFITL